MKEIHGTSTLGIGIVSAQARKMLLELTLKNRQEIYKAGTAAILPLLDTANFSKWKWQIYQVKIKI